MASQWAGHYSHFASCSFRPAEDPLLRPASVSPCAVVVRPPPLACHLLLLSPASLLHRLSSALLFPSFRRHLSGTSPALLRFPASHFSSVRRRPARFRAASSSFLFSGAPSFRRFSSKAVAPSPRALFQLNLDQLTDGDSAGAELLTYILEGGKILLNLYIYNYQRKIQYRVLQLSISRRMGLLATMTSMVLTGEGIFNTEIANGLDFGSMDLDLTIEAAESGVRSHAQALLEIKDLLESESWKEAQKVLRKSSALLKKDIYTIINNKPGSERPQLRKLYSTLFNNVTKLDYAARDKDAPQVWQCYENIVVAINDILSRV